MDARILLIDSYDSFTFNLASLCRTAIPNCSIHIVKNDAISKTDIAPLLSHFSAVIIGPGPGSPLRSADVGVVKDIWKVADESLLPVFGVCLGLQSLAVEFGAEIKRLNVVKHGQISRIEHEGSEIFKGTGDVFAVRYHSLHAELHGDEDLVPLAWADDGEENGRVLMGLKHKTKPFWAVQYHPESVCTTGGGDEVLRNFWRLALSWSAIRGRTLRSWNGRVEAAVGPPWPSLRPRALALETDGEPISTVLTRALRMPGLEFISVCEMLGVSDESTNFVMLESASQPGRFSIVACLSRNSPKITYSVGDRHVQIQRGDICTSDDLGSLDIWTWIASFMRSKRATGGMKCVPFWGGLVGYLSYELGVEHLTSLPRRRAKSFDGRHADVNLVFVERSIVFDSLTGQVYLQSLTPKDNDWISSIVSQLEGLDLSQTNTVSSPSDPGQRIHREAPIVHLPNRGRYMSKIREAKEYLLSGNSYELCVTAPTRISVPRYVSPSRDQSSSSWQLYKNLRRRNPAPHSAYFRLHPSTLLSSSPERFISFSRPPDTVCQLRPIKGTVRKAPGVTRAIAEQALAGSRKEVAENLMIVDLIRHDLHGVLGEDVHVKQFCAVEEYETVWQLVSVIEGKLGNHVDHANQPDLGWEVLHRSLPPGSMTGAPKKRSVEILHSLEDEDRTIYSGVHGYYCVGGGGDWAVTIRSCFKHDTQPSQFGDDHRSEENPDTHSSPDNAQVDEWTLGAGGAITALSDPEAEWEEMVTKVESVLRAFNELKSE
nr:para-aminobenzoic acid synthetase [Mycoleptodonoides aitchisonii]